jgi:hypothetical protein
MPMKIERNSHMSRAALRKPVRTSPLAAYDTRSIEELSNAAGTNLAKISANLRKVQPFRQAPQISVAQAKPFLI